MSSTQTKPYMMCYMNRDEKTKQNYELTDYPKLFRNTYWGNGTFRGDEEIILNRNEFVRKYNITEHISNRPNFIADMLNRNDNPWKDHTEVYKNKDKDYVLVVSPYYGESNKEQMCKEIRNHGYTQIPNMYVDFALSFCKRVLNKKNQKLQDNAVWFGTENGKIVVDFQKEHTWSHKVSTSEELVKLLRDKGMDLTNHNYFCLSSVDFPCDCSEEECDCDPNFDPHTIIENAYNNL